MRKVGFLFLITCLAAQPTLAMLPDYNNYNYNTTSTSNNLPSTNTHQTRSQSIPSYDTAVKKNQPTQETSVDDRLPSYLEVTENLGNRVNPFAHHPTITIHGNPNQQKKCCSDKFQKYTAITTCLLIGVILVVTFALLGNPDNRYPKFSPDATEPQYFENSDHNISNGTNNNFGNPGISRNINNVTKIIWDALLNLGNRTNETLVVHDIG